MGLGLGFAILGRSIFVGDGFSNKYPVLVREVEKVPHIRAPDLCINIIPRRIYGPILRGGFSDG